MPFESDAQKRMMLARAHGWKPKNPRNKHLPSQAVAAKFVADSAGKVKKTIGGIVGPLGRSMDPGTALSGRPLPRPGRGDNRGVTLGKTAAIGPLGSSLVLGKGLAAKRTRGGGPLSGIGAIPTALPPSNMRPRPGRGVNPRLALSGSNYHQAEDRLARLHPR